MPKQATAAAGIVLALQLLMAPPVAADTQCLRGATGSLLRWNAAWQNDHLDDDVLYRVDDVVLINTTASSSATVALSAVSGSAERPDRFLAISSDQLSQSVCERLQKNVRSNFSKKAPKDEKAKSSDRLRFIKYTSRGWVRDDPPQRRTLARCTIAETTFLCLEEEKRRFGDQLEAVEAELQAQPKLYR